MTELQFTRRPVEGPITGGFGDAYPDGAGGTYKHRGVDFGVTRGTTVFAPAGGKIVDFVNDGSFGIGVCIDHPDTPWFSLYAHLSQAKVAVGDRVVAGTVLGFSGDTGKVTGPHLHWQVCKSSAFPTDIAQSADPLSFLVTAPPPVSPISLADVVAFLGGDAAILTWNAKGNSFVIGYSELQANVQTIANHLATLAANPSGTVRADLVRELRELANRLEEVPR